MSYRLDPQIDDRLARLVAGLPSGSPPPTLAGRSVAPYRTARWVLALVAALLVLAAILSYLWLTHTDPLPSSASLQCEQVDPFRCHDSAAIATAWLRKLRGWDPEVLGSVAVQGANYANEWCSQRSCPGSVTDRLTHVSVSAELVDVGYRTTAAVDRVWVVSCPGDDPIVQLASGPRLMPIPGCGSAP